MEQWAKINEKNLDNYSVSDLGRIRNDKTGTILTIVNGHIGVYINRKRKDKKVANLVLNAFTNETTDKRTTIYHKDGDINNNKLTNLILIKPHNINGNEEYKILKDAPNYKISNYGRIQHIKTGNFIHTNSKHFISVYKKDGSIARRSISSLVYKYFSNQPFNENDILWISHKDGNVYNNYIGNLYISKIVPKIQSKKKICHKHVNRSKKIDDFFYKVLHEIESEFGSVAKCPNDDFRLKLLREYGA